MGACLIIAYKHSSTGTAVWWWLRSANCGNDNSFCYVGTDGGCNNSRASWSAGVLAGFCDMRGQME